MEQSKMMDCKAELSNNISNKIWIKDEYGSIKTEPIKFLSYSSNNNQNTTGEVVYDRLLIIIKEETKVVKSEQTELPSYLSSNNENRTTEVVYNDWQNILNKKSDKELHQNKIFEGDKELQHIASGLICVKEETKVVKSEQAEFSSSLSSKDENATKDYGNTHFKGEGISEKSALLNDNDCEILISTPVKYKLISVSKQSLTPNLTGQHSTNSDKLINAENQTVTMNKNIQTKPNICPSKKGNVKIDKQLSIIDNPDCRRIIESGLSRAEKNRATVFCEVCSRTMGYRYYIQVHINIHTGNLPFKCDQCDLRFSKEYMLKRHKYLHSQKKRYKCDKCGKAFALMHHLKVHNVIHSNDRPYMCGICKKSFKFAVSLRNHELSHSTAREFVCEECGKSYCYRKDLTYHQARHLNDKKMPCKICGKLFPNKIILDNHLKRHLTVKILDCATCGKLFTHQQLLDEHLLSHKDIKAHPCEKCGKTFKQNWSLTRHMRVHTGERPYSCKLCTESYKYLYLLKRHMKIHDEEVLETKEEIKDTAN